MITQANGLFQFCFSFSPLDAQSLPEIHLGDAYFYHDYNTPIKYIDAPDKGVLLYGYATDLFEPSCDIVESLIKSNSIEEALQIERMLGGKYVIFLRFGSCWYAIPDATSSVPLFYRTDKVFCASQIPALVAGLHMDESYLKARLSGDFSQALPYDITEYREVRQLLPNHYLDFQKNKAYRFTAASDRIRHLTPEDAANQTLPLIRNLYAYYANHFRIYCPLTGGRDSRVILAIALKNNANTPCYTMRHPEHTEASDDLRIPAALAREYGFPYSCIKDVCVPQSLKDFTAKNIGIYSDRTLRLACTVKAHCNGAAIINGDIIGQVGKVSLHRDIPEIFATPAYFCCKLHNYSPLSKRLLKEWIDDIRASKEQISSFDLFSIENRLGRWAAQENMIYNLLGQPYFNVFNSRSILYPWTSVARGLRKNGAIHSELLRLAYPQIAESKYATDNMGARLSKLHWITYLLASFLKYYLQKLIFKKRNHYETIDRYG